jgi:hypothetical protein
LQTLRVTNDKEMTCGDNTRLEASLAAVNECVDETAGSTALVAAMLLVSDAAAAVDCRSIANADSNIALRHTGSQRQTLETASERASGIRASRELIEHVDHGVVEMQRVRRQCAAFVGRSRRQRPQLDQSRHRLIAVLLHHWINYVHDLIFCAR